MLSRLPFQRGHQEIAKLLLDQEADVDAQGDRGNALHTASAQGHQDIVKSLQQRGTIALSSKQSGSRTTSNPVNKLRIMESEPPDQTQ